MSYFGTIYADTELPSRAKAVYMYLRDRSDAEGKCWPGIKTIASDMKLSRSTVKRALLDLERHVVRGAVRRRAHRRSAGFGARTGRHCGCRGQGRSGGAEDAAVAGDGRVAGPFG